MCVCEGGERKNVCERERACVCEGGGGMYIQSIDFWHALSRGKDATLVHELLFEVCVCGEGEYVLQGTEQ